jgi:DNA-binding response OmpR family regulator
VDDDPAIRRILLRLLAEEGHYVETASDGVKSLEMADASTDLVLLDLNMPGKDGWETFEELSMRLPWLPIILITARSNQFFPALASGVGALLEKPFDFVKLFDTINAFLGESDEMRYARMTGRSALFQYVPPKTDSAQRRINPDANA